MKPVQLMIQILTKFVATLSTEIHPAHFTGTISVMYLAYARYRLLIQYTPTCPTPLRAFVFFCVVLLQLKAKERFVCSLQLTIQFSFRLFY